MTDLVAGHAITKIRHRPSGSKDFVCECGKVVPYLGTIRDGYRRHIEEVGV